MSSTPSPAEIVAEITRNLADNRDFLTRRFAGLIAEQQAVVSEQMDTGFETLRCLADVDPIEQKRDFVALAAMVDALVGIGVDIRLEYRKQMHLEGHHHPEPVVVRGVILRYLCGGQKSCVSICTHYHYRTGDLVRYVVHDGLGEEEKPDRYPVAPADFSGWVGQLTQRVARRYLYWQWGKTVLWQWDRASDPQQAAEWKRYVQESQRMFPS